MELQDIDRVTALKQELDDLVPTDNALIEVRDVRNPDGFELRGNRSGFLRLGIECLRAGLRERDTTTLAERYERLEYLDTRNHNSIVEIQRQDDIRIATEPPPTSPEEERRQERRDNVVFGVLAVGVYGCVFFGAYTIVMWVAGLF